MHFDVSIEAYEEKKILSKQISSIVHIEIDLIVKKEIKIIVFLVDFKLNNMNERIGHEVV